MPMSNSGLSMSIQVDENRIHRFDNLSAGTVIDLGTLEPGWRTFRFYNVRTFSIDANGNALPLKAGLSCSGGFEVDRERDFDIVLASRHGQGLDCHLR